LQLHKFYHKKCLYFRERFSFPSCNELLSFQKQLVNAVEQKFDFDVFVSKFNRFQAFLLEISFISPSNIAIESIEAPIIISMSDNSNCTALIDDKLPSIRPTLASDNVANGISDKAKALSCQTC
jgi:hypothetical protein